MFNRWREWLNRNSSVSTALAVALLVVSLGIIIWTSTGRPPVNPVVDVWYLDLESGLLFTAKSNAIPPINAPSAGAGSESPMGVRAYLYACGECPEQVTGKSPDELLSQQVFIGWLEMYTPESKAQLDAMARGERPVEPISMADPMMYDSVEQGRLIKTLDGQEWVPANSQPGFEIMQQIQSACGQDQMPKPCFPPRK